MTNQDVAGSMIISANSVTGASLSLVFSMVQ